MINNSFLLPNAMQWLRDGQAIVATTEDEGLWVSVDYGETWINIDPGYQLISAVMPSTGMRSDNDVSNIYDIYPSILAATTNGKIYKYRFADNGVAVFDIETQLHRITDGIALIDTTSMFTRRAYDYMPQSKTQYDADKHTFDGIINDCVITLNDAYVALNSGSLKLGNAHTNTDYETINTFGGNAPAKLAYSSKLYVFTASSVWFKNESNEWVEVSLYPDLSLGSGFPEYDRAGNASAGGNAVAIGVPGILLRSSNQGLNWTKYFESEPVQGISMSANGAMQVVAIYNQPLKKWNETSGTFTDILAAKKYTGVHVFRQGATRLYKPVIE